MDGLKVGNEALKKANEMFSIEEIEQIMDDTAEAIEKQKQIDDLLSGQLTQEDEDDVLKELDDLVAADEDISELPEVPSTGMILCMKLTATLCGKGFNFRLLYFQSALLNSFINVHYVYFNENFKIW